MPSEASFRVTGQATPEDIILKLEDARPTEGDLLFAVQRERSRILQRTARGLDVNNQPFAPYSKGYARRKAKSGRNAGVVDLTWSGKMLQSISAKVESIRFEAGRDERVGLNDFRRTAREARLGIYSSAEALRAGVIDSGERGPQREWFHTADSDKPAIAGDIEGRVIERNRKKFGS